MRVLDLFSGLKGWSEPWIENGHDVLTVDFDPRFDADIQKDILDISVEDLAYFRPDVILASPPCEAFSVMNIGKNWYHDHSPKSDAARLGLRLLEHTIYIIDGLAPRWWIIENPVGKMRKLSIMQRYDRVTITQCQYGKVWMKPTDLWGGFPAAWVPRPPCKRGASCHQRAPRGARSGVQGESDPAFRAKIPYELSYEIYEAIIREASCQR